MIYGPMVGCGPSDLLVAQSWASLRRVGPLFLTSSGMDLKDSQLSASDRASVDQVLLTAIITVFLLVSKNVVRYWENYGLVILIIMSYVYIDGFHSQHWIALISGIYCWWILDTDERCWYLLLHRRGDLNQCSKKKPKHFTIFHPWPWEHHPPSTMIQNGQTVRGTATPGSLTMKNPSSLSRVRNRWISEQTCSHKHKLKAKTWPVCKNLACL